MKYVSTPQHTVEPSFLHFLLGDCELHVAVSLHAWHCLDVMLGKVFGSHFEHVVLPSVYVKDPSGHRVQVVESSMSLYWSKGHNDKTGSQAMMNIPFAPEPDFVPDPADAPPEPEFGNPSPPGVDPPIIIRCVPFHALPPNMPPQYAHPTE
jgi:hypothetical protein